jgi:hypothetical protein
MGKKSYGSVFTAKTKKELKAFKKNGTIVVGFKFQVQIGWYVCLKHLAPESLS